MHSYKTSGNIKFFFILAKISANSISAICKPALYFPLFFRQRGKLQLVQICLFSLFSPPALNFSVSTEATGGNYMQTFMLQLNFLSLSRADIFFLQKKRRNPRRVFRPKWKEVGRKSKLNRARNKSSLKTARDWVIYSSWRSDKRLNESCVFFIIYFSEQCYSSIFFCL